jgi:hypothetical protein
MKKHFTVIILFVASQILIAQSDRSAKSVIVESNSKIGVLDPDHPDYKNGEHTIITALVDKNWNGDGMLMGKEATFTMDWQHVLNDQFVKLEFQNKRKSGNNEDIIFSATAFYKIVNDSTVVGNWFDNRGISFPLTGTIHENELIILWGNAETEMGKTIYRCTSNNEITVEDFILRNEKYIKFGYATYNRKDN